jgi:hypothetical protein
MNKTADPYLCDLSLANNIDSLVSVSENYTDIVRLYPDEVATAQYYDYAKHYNFDTIAVFFEDLAKGQLDLATLDIPGLSASDITPSASINLSEFSSQFKLYWLEKFWSSHEAVKSTLLESLGSENEYYINFSESIGTITYLESIKTNSTLDWYDLSHEDQDIEHTIPGHTYNKISYNSKVVDAYLSKLTNTMMKTNMLNIITGDDTDSGNITSESSHGYNLITDSIHYERVVRIIDELKTPLQKALKGMYDILTFIRNYDNKQHLQPLLLDMNIEGVIQKVTAMQTVLKTSPRSERNNAILGSTSQE